MRTRRPEITPRGMTEAATAAYLGRSLSWFVKHKTALIEAGFPAKLPLVDLYDREAVDKWLDRQGDPAEQFARDWSANWQKAAASNG